MPRDQAAIQYIPVAEWTMEKQGSKKVKIAGLDDKRQIIAVLLLPCLVAFYHLNLFTKEPPVPACQQ